jgi:hypothetical protein
VASASDRSNDPNSTENPAFAPGFLLSLIFSAAQSDQRNKKPGAAFAGRVESVLKALISLR